MAIDRYHRQILLPQIGQSGQDKLAASRVLLVGCGALGSTIAEQLTRSGVGFIRIADRDIVEMTNLQRQVLFDESDVQAGLPKAIAAAQRLERINSSSTIEPHVMDVDALNIEKLASDVNLIMDGTDNVATRYLINDVSVKLGINWIYGACVGMEGRVAAIRPQSGPCLRCIFPQPPDPRDLPTCDTAGVLGPVASVVASLQAVAAIKLLTGNESALANEMLSIDLWNLRTRCINLDDAKQSDCPCCGKGQFQFLDAQSIESSARLCGREAVQIRRMTDRISLPDIARRLGVAGSVELTPFMVRCRLSEGNVSLTAFEDGRIIVQGTDDAARAKSIVSRYLGS